MIAQGIPWAVAAAGALAAVAVLALLQFLRVRHPGKRVPSVMLWREAETHPKRRMLWQRFSRPLSLLPALLAVLAAAAALAEPVWDSGKPVRRVVVVAEPGALAEAQALAAKLDPLRTALVCASSSGVILREFGEAALPLPEPASPVPAADRDAVAALARRMAGTGGAVYWLGQTPPPRLPDHSAFLRVEASHPAAPVAPLRVWLENAPEKLRRMAAALPGVEPAANPAEADFAFRSELADGATDGEFAAEAERLYEILRQSGLYGTGGDEQTVLDIPERIETPASAAVRLSGILFALALLATLADFGLWNKRKTI